MKKEDADKIGRKLLEKVGLSDRADFYPSKLSGGQQMPSTTEAESDPV